MGLILSNVFSNVFSRLSHNEQLKLVIVGLERAGKTTLLYKLKQEEPVTLCPTIGFNVEPVEYNNISFTVWDLGTHFRIKRFWKHYYQNTKALIFVVDSADHERIEEASWELQKVLQEDELRDAVLLILANKQDLPQAMPVQDITEKLGLRSVTDRTWYVQSACAISGTGLYEGLNWLSDQLSK